MKYNPSVMNLALTVLDHKGETLFGGIMEFLKELSGRPSADHYVSEDIDEDVDVEIDLEPEGAYNPIPVSVSSTPQPKRISEKPKLIIGEC